MGQFDAIVVGSGISGGWAAKELCEKGLKVLLLERGGPYDHIKDYKTSNLDPWEKTYREQTTTEQKKNYQAIHRGWAANESVMDGWANEIDNPYVEVKPFTWWRSYRMGGRSILWGRQSYRFSEMDFEANAKEGIGIDWPVRYADIAPWYDYVEKHAGISGSLERLPQLPDGQFLPPMELNCVEKDAAERIKKAFEGKRHLFIGRVANLTAPIKGRTQCQYRNRCWEGCPFGGYFSSQSSTLPVAMKTGNLTIRPWSIVTEVVYDKDSKKATGVKILDAETSEVLEYKSKIVFLCASALNSAWILMNSATDVWQDGLGSSSGQLGRNVMDHHYNVGAFGKIPGFEDKYVYGRRANGFYIPRFTNLIGDKREYLRGFGYQGGASREGWGREIAELQIGGGYKDALTEPGFWNMGMTAFGEILPDKKNRIYLHPTQKDKWGLPVLAMDAELKENEMKMRKDMQAEAIHMLEVSGAENINSWDNGHAMGHGVHEMGTARMGKEAKTSVLNKWNQIWDAPNVFVTDGAFMTSSGCQNPSLGYMAFTARAADYAVDQLKKMNI